MSWITENAWPLIVVCVALGVMAGIMFDAKGRMAAIGLFLLAGLFWWIEGRVVTEAEVLERDLQTMLDGFKQQNEAAVHGQISDQSPNLRSVASQGMDMVKLEDSFHLKDVRITLSEDGNQATVHLRANGQAVLKQSSYSQTVATRWETTWAKEAGLWKLIGVKRLDVVSGKEMGILDPG